MHRVAADETFFAGDILLSHTMARSYLFYPEHLDRARAQTYSASKDFWREALDERVIAERVVTLLSFNIFEWTPRNPGLYYSRGAAQYREDAQQFVRYGPLGQKVSGLILESPDHAAVFRSVTSSSGSARQLIYTPQGKASMLEGGVGCVRLAPVEVKHRGTFWFMSATSTSAPDQGIPLLVPNTIYQSIIDEVRTSGYALADVKGVVKFIPKEFRDLYAQRRGLPRLYVEVSGVNRPPESSRKKRRRFEAEVSVAATFLSEYEGYPKIYASYVTFDPSREGAQRSAAQWMRDEYIQGLYNGSPLTDFDQQAPSIANTLFSLDDVLTSPDLVTQIALLRKKFGRFDWEMLEKSVISFHTHQENLMVKVNAVGQGIVVNVAKYMRDVINTVNGNVGEAAVSPDIKDLVKKLSEQVVSVATQIDDVNAQKLGKNLERLSEELKSTTPEKKWYEVSLDGLKDAASAVGQIGVPIIETVEKLKTMLVG